MPRRPDVLTKNKERDKIVSLEVWEGIHKCHRYSFPGALQPVALSVPLRGLLLKSAL